MANRRVIIRRKAPAKINLGLHVLGRRGDGYHEIETLMVPIAWSDVLHFEPSGEAFRFTCSDPSLPTDESNLCVQAALLFAELAGTTPVGHLHLEKHIPHGAGLGGGSSDAATTLRLLGRQWDVEVDRAELHRLAAGLGSDVPFFLSDGPQLAAGRGEKLSAIDGFELIYPIAVVMPAVTVSTRDAYEMVAASGPGRKNIADIVRTGDLEVWRESLRNDFQEPVFDRFPQVAAEWRRLLDGGARYAALSGSGSAVFGLFDQRDDARMAAADARQRGLRSWSGRAA